MNFANGPGGFFGRVLCSTIYDASAGTWFIRRFGVSTLLNEFLQRASFCGVFLWCAKYFSLAGTWVVRHIWASTLLNGFRRLSRWAFKERFTIHHSIKQQSVLNVQNICICWIDFTDGQGHFKHEPSVVASALEAFRHNSTDCSFASNGQWNRSLEAAIWERPFSPEQERWFYKSLTVSELESEI